jgi:hypothetical protein
VPVCLEKWKLKALLSWLTCCKFSTFDGGYLPREAYGWRVVDVNLSGIFLCCTSGLNPPYIKTPLKNLLKGRFFNGVLT